MILHHVTPGLNLLGPAPRMTADFVTGQFLSEPGGVATGRPLHYRFQVPPNGSEIAKRERVAKVKVFELNVRRSLPSATSDNQAVA